MAEVDLGLGKDRQVTRIMQVAPGDLSAAQRSKAIAHFRKFMEMMGIVITPDMEETPRRVVDAWREWMHDEPWNFTDFESPHPNTTVGGPGDVGIVMVRNIPLNSMCAHHIMPFYGKAHIAYVPGARVLGLSKFARLVTSFAKGPQTQEAIGANVADAIMDAVDPRGVMVVLEAVHTCMTLRGACAYGSSTTTSALRGVFYTDPRTRDEAMTLLLRPVP